MRRRWGRERGGKRRRSANQRTMKTRRKKYHILVKWTAASPHQSTRDRTKRNKPVRPQPEEDETKGEPATRTLSARIEKNRRVHCSRPLLRSLPSKSSGFCKTNTCFRGNNPSLRQKQETGSPGLTCGLTGAMWTQPTQRHTWQLGTHTPDNYWNTWTNTWWLRTLLQTHWPIKVTKVHTHTH